MRALFIRETFEQYNSWRPQVLIYATVFAITVLFAVTLDLTGQVSLGNVLLFTVGSTLVLLLVVPASYVAFRSGATGASKLRSIHITIPKSDDTQRTVTAGDRQGDPLLGHWISKSAELSLWQSRMLTDFTDRQLALMLLAVIWQMRLSIVKRVEAVEGSQPPMSPEYRHGFHDGLDAVVSVFLKELQVLKAAAVTTHEVRDEVE